MVRTREWKYIHRYPDGPHELYHLADDPSEQTNLVFDHAYNDRANELKARLEDWFARYAEPDRDGRVQPVTGSGQRGLVGGADTGQRSFF